MVDSLCADAVKSLNALASARAGRTMRWSPLSPPLRSAADGIQTSAAARVRCAAEFYASGRPASSSSDPLRDLLRTRNLYAPVDASGRVPIDLNLLRVCREGVHLKDVTKLVGDEAVPFVMDSRRLILKSDRELVEGDTLDVVPFTDPWLTEDPRNMGKLIRSLWSRGLITFRQRASAFVGVFAVSKKTRFGRDWCSTRVSQMLCAADLLMRRCLRPAPSALST